MGLMAFHALFLMVTLLSRRHLNFHMFLFLFACKLNNTHLLSSLLDASPWQAFLSFNPTRHSQHLQLCYVRFSFVFCFFWFSTIPKVFYTIMISFFFLLSVFISSIQGSHTSLGCSIHIVPWTGELVLTLLSLHLYGFFFFFWPSITI